MPELELNPDIVRSLIDKAHEFHSREDVTFPDEPEDVQPEWAEMVTADYSTDPYYMEIKNLIEDLEPDQQMMIVALMWVGRGDYGVDEWADALAFAEETWTDHTAEYLIGTALLADYLDLGLESFESAE